MKLELKHIVGYLPYGLNLKYEQEGDVRKLVYLDLQSPDRIGMNVKPLLYPLSFLTKEITVDGKTFVPIVELALMMEDYDHVDFDGDFSDYKLQIDDEWNYCVTFNGQTNDLCFSFDAENKSFLCSIDFEEQFISNQYDMFQKMFEWHFDIEDLIEQNLAIDKTINQ